MKISLRWLQEFIDLPTTDPDELGEVLTRLGHTVEDVRRLEAAWEDVVVGRVTGISAHPDADKIRVCQVDVGGGPTQIICGAWNFEEGAHVAVARPGAVLQGGLEIGRREIRGVVSNGMICSEAELGLGDDHSGILVLEGKPEIGTDFSELVELPDTIYDLDITTDRPDAMSLLGIARDLAAHYRTDYRVPERELSTIEGGVGITIEIEDPEGCRRFTAREIVGVTVAPSPLWVRHRLRKVGVRPVSNVVDATNYVMLELGHPLHVFDADTIVGDRLVVRRAGSGEKLETLDHEKRALHPDDLIIYDDEGPTSMAGTMGGARSEVSDDSTRLLMEAASWDPPTIMFMSRRHGLPSEASIRFERGVDPGLADIANARASAMVAEIAGGKVLEGAVDVVAKEIEEAVIELSTAEVERLLGPGFDQDKVRELLQRLGMGVGPGDPMTVTVPTYRPDVIQPVDLVEEVARLHGYDEFDPSISTGPAGGLTREQRRLRRLQSSLTGVGFSQAISLPFVGLDDLKAFDADISPSDLLTVKNPLREEESKLRPSLLPGLVSALRYNRSHGAGSVALFETGKVFFSTPDPADPRLPFQPDHLAWAMIGGVGIRQFDAVETEASAQVSLAVWRHLAGSLGIEDVGLEPASPPGYHPGRTARVRIGDRTIGHVGELHPGTAAAFDLSARVAVAELDLDPLLAPVAPVVGQSPSVFPHVDFDLSFVCGPDVSAAELLGVTTEAAEDLLEWAQVFDEYRGPGVGAGERALAIRYRLRAPDRTLSNEEVAPVRSAMIEAAARLGCELRGT
jgi:phenylalanyl-tRNA synthetase beta chain